MAGPSLISGLAGSVSGGGGGAQGSNSGPDLLRIVQAVQQIQEQKKQSARSDLDAMLGLLEKHGMAPDEKTFMTTAKNAGIPIENITAAVSGKDAVKTGNSFQGNKQGAQSAFALPSNSAEKNPGGGVSTTVDSNQTQSGIAQSKIGGSGTGPKASPFDSMVQRAQARIENEATNASDKANLERLVNHLKQQAGEGDSEAVGKLMNMGGIEFKMDQMMWNEATPQERKSMIGIAAGQESPAQKELRLSNQASSLFGSGRYKTLQDARAAAEGKPVETLVDLGRMADEAKLMNELFAATGDSKIAKEVAMKMANGVSLADAVPAGVSPILEQQLGLQKRQVKAEEDRVKISRDQLGISKDQLAVQREGLGLEKARDILNWSTKMAEAENDARQMILTLEKDKDEQFNKRFAHYVQMKNAGITIDKTFEDNMINELAVRSGMIPEKVQTSWEWLTGGGHFGFSPDMSQDQSLLDKATGGSQKPGEQKTPTPVGTSTKSEPDYTPVGEPITKAVTSAIGMISGVGNKIGKVFTSPLETGKKLLNKAEETKRRVEAEKKKRREELAKKRKP